MAQSKEAPEVLALDPRVRRSRQMLHDGLASLLRQKAFQDISIQDISEASTLNRATFYAHYPDKHTLLHCMVGSRFQELMASRDVRLGSCAGALKSLALGTCDFLHETSRGMQGGTRPVEGSLETAVIAVLRAILHEGVSQRALNGTVSVELLTGTVAWAIFGAANTWAQDPKGCSAEEMAEVIDRLVSPILESAVAPVAPPRPTPAIRRRIERTGRFQGASGGDPG